MLKLTNVKKSYPMGEHQVHALNGVSLTIDEGDFVAIMGPSGSGKSTLMHILGLLDVPTSGNYQLDGHEVAHLSEDELALIRRRKIGFIFQQFNLLARVSATENVALPQLYSQQRLDLDQARTLLEQVGLGKRTEHRPNELSGGQQQRVAIARSLINRPRVIFADEPTGNLDSASEVEILDILKNLNQQGITVILVTHEEEVARHAKRVIRMRDGNVQSDQRLQPVSTPDTSVSSSLQDSELDSPSRLRELLEYFRQGFKTLAANKVRTGLSMLGILIGVGAVVAMLALGRGAQKAIESQLASLGSNLLVLRPGPLRVGGVAQEAGAATRITLEDVSSLLEQIRSIRHASPNVNGKAQVTFQNKNWSTQILGTGPSYPLMRASQPQMGRFYTDVENQKRTRVAVIGMTVARELFGQENPMGEMIKINKVNFQIIGLLPEKGANGWRDQDDIVVIPVLTAMHRLLGKDYVDSIDIEMTDAAEIESAQREIIRIMNTRHRIPSVHQKSAFEIRNLADVQAALAQSGETMSLLLSSIAAISLLVGGIGIMNIMLVSVTERTREIGLRKALGAKRADILAQFLSESAVVSTVGGVIGIVLGWLITVILSAVAGWTTSISLGSVALAFFFSAAVGVVFGIYPARKASLLQPIEALRHE